MRIMEEKMETTIMDYIGFRVCMEIVGGPLLEISFENLTFLQP